MLYKNCRELPYHNFNEVQVENDLSYLIKDLERRRAFEDLMIINNDPNQTFTDENKESFDTVFDELQRHWIDILDEYFALTEDYSQMKFFKDRSELLFLETKKEILETLLKVKDIELDEEQKKIYNDILKKYRVTDLEVSILGTNDDINLKINQLNKVKTNENKSNFEETLSAMRINGVSVNRHEVTVAEFVSLVKMMKKRASKTKSNTRTK